MKQFVESLKRLYGVQKINKEKVTEMYKKNIITKEEMDYIFNQN